MKIRLIAALCLLVLSGCAAVPPSAWTFDPTRAQDKPTLATEEATLLGNRVAELQVRRAEIQSQIAMEADARNRQPLYAQLHVVGSELSPLERRLAAYTGVR